MTPDFEHRPKIRLSGLHLESVYCSHIGGDNKITDIHPPPLQPSERRICRIQVWFKTDTKLVGVTGVFYSVSCRLHLNDYSLLNLAYRTYLHRLSHFLLASDLSRPHKISFFGRVLQTMPYCTVARYSLLRHYFVATELKRSAPTGLSTVHVGPFWVISFPPGSAARR